MPAVPAKSQRTAPVNPAAPSQPSYTFGSGGRDWKPVVVLLLLLAAFLLLQCLMPLGTAIKIGADEDFELAKATLSLKGYKFYTQVWNDQPLLHTVLITQVLKQVSPSVLGPRLVTSAFTLLLLAAVFVISHRVGGLLAATLATGLLIASPEFLVLASSCMLEIPALAPVIGALGLLLARRQGRWRLAEILAGRPWSSCPA